MKKIKHYFKTVLLVPLVCTIACVIATYQLYYKCDEPGVTITGIGFTIVAFLWLQMARYYLQDLWKETHFA